MRASVSRNEVETVNVCFLCFSVHIKQLSSLEICISKIVSICLYSNFQRLKQLQCMLHSDLYLHIKLSKATLFWVRRLYLSLKHLRICTNALTHFVQIRGWNSLETRRKFIKFWIGLQLKEKMSASKAFSELFQSLSMLSLKCQRKVPKYARRLYWMPKATAAKTNEANYSLHIIAIKVVYIFSKPLISIRANEMCLYFPKSWLCHYSWVGGFVFAMRLDKFNQFTSYSYRFEARFCLPRSSICV